MWIFADHHPYIAFFALCVAAGTITAPLRWSWMAYNRFLRSKNIAARGWPTAPLMDADGDIVHPKPTN